MRRIIGFISAIAFIAVSISLEGCNENSTSCVLRIAFPYSDHITDISENYYVRYLKEKTGYTIDPVIVRDRNASEYLDDLFAADSDIDIVMFGDGFTVSDDELAAYADRGLLHKRTNGMCYYENRGRSGAGDCGQILWINAGWLDALGLSIPGDTEEFQKVLEEFKNKDPNGNGTSDEIPLLGSLDDPAYDPQILLMNSFLYYDGFEESRSSSDPGYQKGREYCEMLQQSGLLDARTFEYSRASLAEAVNSPEDIVGAFTSDSISNVIYPGNPDIMARYIHVAPLEGPEGVRNAVYRKRAAEVGAIIPSFSKHITEADHLLETMLDEESSLIARFGEEGVDWEHSDGADVSIFGTGSTIVTRNYIWNTLQNKHLNGIGPMNVKDEYLKGVTWNGINSDAEYVDARAQMSYEPFLPEGILNR